MGTTPSATTVIDAEAGGVAVGANLIAVISPVKTNADHKPRLFGSAKAAYDFHDYNEGVEYAAIHVEETRQPVLFIGIPIETPGAIGAEDTSGNTGTSVSTVAAGSDGVLAEHDGVVSVISGGTIGTHQIVLGLSLDGGRTTKRVRLGTNSSYVVPYHGVTISFAAGTLVTGDIVHTWHGSQPRGNSDGWQEARQQLAAQMKQFRTALIIGDMQDSDDAAAVLAQANAYETADQRFVEFRVNVRDRLPFASLSKNTVRMSGSPSVTFAEVDTVGDTITRATGSFVADGFRVGDLITVSGTPSGTNDVTAESGITAVSATVLTLDDDDLADQGPVSAIITGQGSLTFANTGETITRNRGSWLDDGFRVGQTVTITGTASGTNDGSFVVAAVTPTVLTLATGGVTADEVIGMNDVTITAGEQMAAWAAAMESEFAPVDDAERIDLAMGRGRKLSPFTGYMYRRPAAWAMAVREFQHDLHVATWRKDLGPLPGWTLLDSDGNLAEYDDRVDGSAASIARFSSLRTWGNGPSGAFVSQSLTRAPDGSVLAPTHNMHVVNAGQTIVQSTTELAIGVDLVLNEDGTATSDSLTTISSRVNAALQLGLLSDFGEGVRASKAVWTPSADDILSGPQALLTGVLDLVLKGTVHSVFTRVRVS